MLHDPAAVDAHVVGHHVAGQTDTAGRRAIAQGRIGRAAAQVAGDLVVSQRIGRGHGFRIAAPLFDLLRGARAFPQADQPQAGHAPAGELVQFLVRDLVQALHRSLVPAGELVKPDVDRLGEQHQIAHPIGVAAEGFGFRVAVVGAGAVGAELQHRRRTRREDAVQIHLAQQVPRPVELGHELIRQQARPVIADEGQLTVQGVGRGEHGRAQKLEEGRAGQPCRLLAGEEFLETDHEGHVGGADLQLVVVEELTAGAGGRIAHGQEEKDHLQGHHVLGGGDRYVQLTQIAFPVETTRLYDAGRKEIPEGRVDPGHRIGADPLAGEIPAAVDDARMIAQAIALGQEA